MTTTSENPSGFCLFCAYLGFCHFILIGITKFKYERTENEMNSGLSSKKTPSFKWPFPFSFLKIHGRHRSSDPCILHNANKVRELEVKRFSLVYTDHRRMDPDTRGLFLRACLHGGGGPQTGEVTRGGSPHLSCKSDHIKMRDFMDRRFTPPTWSPPPPCKQPLNLLPMIERFLN